MKRKFFTLLTVLALVMTMALPVTAADLCSRCTVSPLEQAAGELVNSHRKAHGLEPLTISADLSAKARIKAADMKQNRYFSHTSPTYGSPFSMMRSLGVSYRSAAENIAMGYRTAEAVVSAWMNSPSHRANILSSKYEVMGIGHTGGYWAQWFTD